MCSVVAKDLRVSRRVGIHAGNEDVQAKKRPRLAYRRKLLHRIGQSSWFWVCWQLSIFGYFVGLANQNYAPDYVSRAGGIISFYALVIGGRTVLRDCFDELVPDDPKIQAWEKMRDRRAGKIALITGLIGTLCWAMGDEVVRFIGNTFLGRKIPW